jgi:hypothetical protein
MKLAPNSDWAFDPERFRWRLAEVISWCQERVIADQPATCLRSDELQPPTYHYWSNPPHERLRLAAYPREDGGEMVEQLAQRRTDLLRTAGQYPTAPAIDLATGALLMYYPGLNLFDGAAEVVSAGFFDSDNIPAWDTWVAFLPGAPGDEVLVSWIPPLLFPNAQQGVEVNPEACIEWASGVDSPFTRSLREAGIMGTSR